MPSIPIDDPFRRDRLLVFNCHEAWVHQLRWLPFDLDIVVGLSGRSVEGWDARMRPVPENGRIVTLDEARSGRMRYACVVAHNITDLLDAREIPGPRLLVIHSTLHGRLQEERSAEDPGKIRARLRQYIELVGGHVVAVSALKGRSWGFPDDIVRFGVDVDDYPPFSGAEECGLRVASHIHRKRKVLLWEFHEKAFAGVPVRIVGHNPNMPGVEASRDWDDLKDILRRHRFYIHTADPELEDGYNMAMVEAMAAGMPILGNRHPSSPVEDGVSGFLSDDPDELRARARLLLADVERARAMGREARRAARRAFGKEIFGQGLSRSIDAARRIR